MTEHLAEWQAVLDAPAIGRLGNRLTYEAGPAHPHGYAPCWVTAHGADLGRLHTAYIARRLSEHRGEDTECHVL